MPANFLIFFLALFIKEIQRVKINGHNHPSLLKDVLYISLDLNKKKTAKIRWPCAEVTMIMLDAVSHKKEQQRINSHEIFQNLIYNVPLNKDPRKLTEQELYRKTRNNPVINPCENIRDLFSN